MRQESLAVLACPRCLGPLSLPRAPSSSSSVAELECADENLRFPIIGGIPQLVSPERANAVRAIAEAYSLVWRKDGWGCALPSYLLNLPDRDTTGRQSGKWRVKARSMDALFELFRTLVPRRVLDLGCGVGWLTDRLARRGHEAFAIDILQDEVLGLRAADAYLHAGSVFERVWGELERPPFQAETFDAVVCNASLHYAASLEVALAEVKRILRPRGVFVVMNSPVHNDAQSAQRAERSFRLRLSRLEASEDLVSRYHHFVRSRLEAALTAAIGPPRLQQFDPGRNFRLTRRAKGVLLGMELASFPIVWAQKRTETT
jgi:SAM-dependent methyltransferase